MDVLRAYVPVILISVELLFAVQSRIHSEEKRLSIENELETQLLDRTKSINDCFYESTAYQGAIDTTVSDVQCIDWSAVSHPNSLEAMLAGTSLHAAGNRCRDPGDEVIQQTVPSSSPGSSTPSSSAPLTSTIATSLSTLLTSGCSDVVDCRSTSPINPFWAESYLAQKLCRKTCNKCALPVIPITYNTCGDPVSDGVCQSLQKEICICEELDLVKICPNFCSNRCGPIEKCRTSPSLIGRSLMGKADIAGKLRS